MKNINILDFKKTAVRVSLVSIIWNLILSALKAVAGLLAGSGAMISDAVHSASDVFSSFVVMIGVKISSKEEDKEHPYGHERIECVAAIILATILAATGLGIGYSALTSIIHKDYIGKVPGILALVAAVLSIVVKEAMFWYTRHYAKRIDSSALMADAWHHRSDSLSSIGALIGIGGTMLGYHIMEPLASIVICLFIEKASYDIFKDAIDKVIDTSCDEETEEAIKHCALSISGVLAVDLLHTRVFANKIYVDMEIAANGDQTLLEAHDIAEKVHDAIEEHFPKVKHIMVHVNPK